MNDFRHYSGEGPNPPPGMLPKFKVGDLVRFVNLIWKVFGIRWCTPPYGELDGYFRYDIRKDDGRDACNAPENLLELVELSSWEKESL